MRILKPGEWFIAFQDIQPNDGPVIAKRPEMFAAFSYLGKNIASGDFEGYHVLVFFRKGDVEMARLLNPPKDKAVNLLLDMQLNAPKKNVHAGAVFDIEGITEELGIKSSEAIARLTKWLYETHSRADITGRLVGGLDIQDSAIVLDEYVAESQELMKECGYWNIDSGLVTGSITLPIEESPVKPKGTANTIFYNMGAVNHYYEDSVPEGSVKIRNRIHYIAGQKPG